MVKARVGMVNRRLLALMVIGLALPPSVAAQVGFASNVARVTLVARIAPKASIQGVGAARETGLDGSVRQASVMVRLSTNTAYRLKVVGTSDMGGQASRLWVRSHDGVYQELTPGTSVTVAQGTRSAGQWDREVSYRIEPSAENSAAGLPVRYEIVVDPTI